jgi:hypothetical protein
MIHYIIFVIIIIIPDILTNDEKYIPFCIFEKKEDFLIDFVSSFSCYETTYNYQSNITFLL